MPTQVTLETDRLLIRPTNVNDAAFILELLNTPKWISFIGDRNLQTVEDAQNYIKDRMLPQLEKLGFSNNTVILKDGNEKIGVCGLYDREGIDGVDIGFAFLPKFEGLGYAFEASQKVIENGFSNLGINSVSAITIPENKSSQKLIEKLGLIYQGEIQIPNDDELLMLYRLDKK